MKILRCTAVAALLCAVPLPCLAAIVSGPMEKWQPIELDVAGPQAMESGDNPNPFLDIRLTVTLTAPSGENYQVPGFFAGDGAGNGNGSVWRIRFTPDEVGRWTYNTSLRQGNDVAVSAESNAGVALPADGETGEFTIAERAEDATGFFRDGRLEYVGAHYLKQADGDYWIKGGVDSPENFFAYAGFDNTVDQPGGVTGGAALQNGLHRYSSHRADWQPGDPDFTSSDTGIDAKGIIGAINYLSSESVNSIYFLPMNLGGDGRDTYPFIGATGSESDNTHYDVSKLAQWNNVLNHMQSKGIAAHVVLGEQEIDNTNWLDNGQLGVQRKLFYRELIARFAHLNALKWNLSEESRLGNELHAEIAAYIRSLDWAQHPIGVHSWVDNPGRAYDALLGNTDFDISSIQYHADKADEFTESWRARSTEAGWPWVIDMDEIGPGNIGLNPDNIEQMRKEVLYPVYFSGGNVEWYFGTKAADIRTEDFRQHEDMYRYMRYARNFMQTHLPFHEMSPNDDALTNGAALDQVFEKPGEVYAVYLANAQTAKSLQVIDGNYTQSWFNPRSGEFAGEEIQVTGDLIDLGDAPQSATEDWVVLLESVAIEVTSPEPETEVVPEPEVGAANPEAEQVEVEQVKVEGGSGLFGLGLVLLLSMVAWVRRLAPDDL